MKFNDYKIIGDKDCEILNTKFADVFTEEYRDLNEIIDKMKKQKEILSKENTNNKYSTLIDKLTTDIEKLENIVRSTMYSKSMSDSYRISVPSDYRNLRKFDNTERLSPVRSREENAIHNEYLNNNVPKNISPIKKMQRGSPMQNFSLANIFRKFTLNTNKKSAKTAPIDRYRFHTIITTSCPPQKQILHNQEDIIRLLLLFMVIRPRCPYLPIIANISSSQFEGYMNLQ